MFNKLKMAIPCGNKKQREASKEEQKANDDMFIEITKLELRKERVIFPFIKKDTDNDEAPNYILQQAVNTTKVMDHEIRRQKIDFLSSHNIITIVEEETAVVTGFKNAVDMGEGATCGVCKKRFCICDERNEDKSWTKKED